MSMKYLWLVAVLFFGAYLRADTKLEYQKIKKYFFSPDIISLPISNWTNPSYDDWRLIQQFMEKKLAFLEQTPPSQRPFPKAYLNTEFYSWIVRRLKFQFVEEGGKKPIFKIEYFGNDPSKKNKCVICYSSFPHGTPRKDYYQGISYIIKGLQHSHFDGHFIYRVGGCPNVENGRLRYVDVPYAFKPFMFEEAKLLGYKNILWLDACCIPLKSLDPIFEHIQREGLCYFSLGSLTWKPFHKGLKYLMPRFGISEQKEYEWNTTQIVGINVDHPKGNLLLNEWLKTAEQKVPLIEGTDPPFSFILNKHNLIGPKFHISGEYFGEMAWTSLDFEDFKRKNPHTLVVHQYAFLFPEVNSVQNIFD